MAINKIPKNYYSDTNIRRDKINEIIDEVNDIASIPSPSEADAGKVLTVDNNGTWELDNVPAELPTVTSADAGKVLTVDSQGAWGTDNVPVNIIEELVFSDNAYHLTKHTTCSELYATIGESVNKGIVPYIKVDNKFVPCTVYQHIAGILENSIFIGMCREYQTNFLVDVFTIKNNSASTVTITTYAVARTIYS